MKASGSRQPRRLSAEPVTRRPRKQPATETTTPKTKLVRQLARASRPFSLNSTGTLSRRHLAHFVSAVDSRMRSSDCMKSSSDGSRHRPCCPLRKPRPCCFGLCWLLARSRCARWTAGRASPRSLPIRSLTLPPDAVTSSRWRSRQPQFQHKSRRHLPQCVQV